MQPWQINQQLNQQAQQTSHRMHEQAASSARQAHEMGRQSAERFARQSQYHGSSRSGGGFLVTLVKLAFLAAVLYAGYAIYQNW